MKPVGGAKNFSNDHWLHHMMNTEKSDFNSYIYTLFLDFFYAFLSSIFSVKFAQYMVK